ncbi:MAG: penicillin acylase family protein [Acidobacteriota bacterium]
MRAGSTRFYPWILALGLTTFACQPSETLPGEGSDENETVVYRDTWGVAHVYAPTVSAGLYAMGWAMAEDRPEQLLVNFALALGEYSKVVGEGAVPSDLRSKMFDHYGAGQRGFEQMSETFRGHTQSFADGMNAFYAGHPEDVPDWWGEREIDAAMVLAFGRLFLYNWSIDEAYGDLQRGGIAPGYRPPSRGSNQFAVAPERSAAGAALLAVDPHLAWEGPSRFWEFRIHAGELVGSGVTLPGSPYIGLGHNRKVAWAMTTGGPDTADVFALELDEEGSRYRYDDGWRDLDQRQVTLEIADGESQEHTLYFSHHGPVIARDGNRAWSARIAYDDLVTMEPWYLLSTAEDYTGAVAALATLTVFPQNVMVADTSGNIYYQRTGRVPVRSEDFDWSRPVDGSTSASEWQGVHPATDHLQVLNPPHGWMQNNNIPPDAMMPNSPFSLDETRDYLYSGPGYGPERCCWTSQRGARAIELLQSDDSVTVEEAEAYINDVEPYGAGRWIEALRSAQAASPEALTAEATEALELLSSWDRQLRADSAGALQYELWRQQLLDDLGREKVGAIAAGIDDYYAIVEGREETPVAVSEEAQAQLLESLARATKRRLETYGPEGTYGDRFRVGRGGQSWPVGGGGGRTGTTTLRNLGFGPEREDGTRWGRGGQTSTQVVLLTDPPQSWQYLPLGQSDRPTSPHYADQAERLFSTRQLKPTWWLPEELAEHIESRTVLEGAPQ